MNQPPARPQGGKLAPEEGDIAALAKGGRTNVAGFLLRLFNGLGAIVGLPAAGKCQCHQCQRRNAVPVHSHRPAAFHEIPLWKGQASRGHSVRQGFVAGRLADWLLTNLPACNIMRANQNP